MMGPGGPEQEGDEVIGCRRLVDIPGLLSKSPTVNSHSETVQALRKYLLRKMSSEESSGDKELEGTPEKVVSVAEANGSKLYCSLVQRPVEEIEKSHHNRNQGNKIRCLSKHQSLDLDFGGSSNSTNSDFGLRYLRTDLCIPVLHSKCSFCDDFFETEEQLRKHLRDSHFQYFLNYVQLRPLTSTKSLSDLPFSSALQISSSDSPISSSSSVNKYENGDMCGTGNFNEMSFLQGGKYYGKKPVRCEICGKCFTTKWNCKQHLKSHMKEATVASLMMDTGTLSSASGGEPSPPLPSSSASSSGSSFL